MIIIINRGWTNLVVSGAKPHQESVMFAFFVLFVLLLLFSGVKSKIQKSTDYFSKANPSTFSILFSCFSIFFSTFLGHLQK